MSIKIARKINKKVFLSWLESWGLEPEELNNWREITQVLGSERLIEIYEYLKQCPDDIPAVTENLRQKIELVKKLSESKS